MKKWLRRIFWTLLLCSILLLTGLLIVGYPIWKALERETIEMIDDHKDFQSIHPGWSFPSTLYSAPAPLSLPKKRRIDQAKVRNYTLQCPATKPGEYCTDGTIIPRGGLFMEGLQPPGLDNWTRELALEPVNMGTIIGKDSEVRKHLPIDEAPPHLIAALLHSEDNQFYKHDGVNYWAFGRAILANLQGGGYNQGASTITMQVVRNMSQQHKKTIQRKLKEMAQAIIMDRYLSKKEILQMYLDMPYLGQDGSFSICGFAAAAEFYFQKDVREIDLNEAAILVGILPAPGSFRPDKYPERAQEKRDRVLRIMQKEGWNVKKALESPIPIASVSTLTNFQNPAFVQASISWLTDNIAEETLYGAGLNIFTSMDLLLQQSTESLFEEKLQYYTKVLRLPKNPAMQAAGVLINPKTGYMEAVYAGEIVSPYDFSRATQAKRQPGSSFKPLVYALAFSQKDEQGDPIWNSFDTIPNERRTFPNTNGWRPRNNGGKYSETSTLTKGLTWSENVATASLLEKLGGPKPLIEFAQQLGFDTTKFPEEMGLALGQAEVTPLEMAQFAAMLANGGLHVDGRPIITAFDLTGKQYIIDSPIGDRVLQEDAAALTRDLMKSVVLNGTGGASRGANGEIGYTGLAFGKTGTTDSNKDLWFVGSTPTYSGSLWIGYDKPIDLKASASDLAAPLWGWWMREMHQDLSLESTFMGLQLEPKYVCTVSGKYKNSTCKTLAHPTLPNHRPKGQCSMEHPPPDPNQPKYQGLWNR